MNDSGAQVLVKLLDCQLFGMAKTFLKSPSTRYVPVGKEKIFTYDKKKWKGDSHNISKAIPKGKTAEEFEAEVNKMFAGHYRLMDAGVEGWEEFVPPEKEEKTKKAEDGGKKATEEKDDKKTPETDDDEGASAAAGRGADKHAPMVPRRALWRARRRHAWHKGGLSSTTFRATRVIESRSRGTWRTNALD